MVDSLRFFVKIHKVNFCYLLENFVKQNFTLNYKPSTTNNKTFNYIFSKLILESSVSTFNTLTLIVCPTETISCGFDTNLSLSLDI